MKKNPLFALTLCILFSSLSIGLRSADLPVPSNDECVNAITIACGVNIDGSTIEATVEDPDPGFCGTSAGTGGGVWYKFVGLNSYDGSAGFGDAGDVVSLSLCNDADSLGSTNFDSKIRVYSGTCGSLTCVDGNDDFTGCTSNSSFTVFNTIVGTEYYILVHGWTSSIGDFNLLMTCDEVNTCTPPSDLSLSNIGSNTVGLQWTEDGEASIWNIEYGVAGFSQGTGTSLSVLSTSIELTGLIESTTYDYYVRSACTEGSSEWVQSEFTTLGDLCGGDAFVDTGDSLGTYSANELITYHLCADSPGDQVTLYFNEVDLDASSFGGGLNGCYDYLSIYNGPDTQSPLLAATLCGEASGTLPSVASSVLEPGDYFVSDNSDGCLTVVFTSSSFTELEGWSADVICGTPTLCPRPYEIELTELAPAEVAIVWEDDSSNYEWIVEYGLAGFTPGTGILSVEDSMSIVLSNLSPNTQYDVYIRANCSIGSSLSRMFTFTSAGDYCGGDTFIDSGDSLDYSANELIVYSICPDTPGDVVSMMFNFVDIGATGVSEGILNGCMDYLAIYNGPDTLSDVLAESLCGTSGSLSISPYDYSSLLLPGDYFISTDSSGCLTAVFTSNSTSQFGGWEADIICGPPSLCSQPSAASFTQVTRNEAIVEWEDASENSFWKIEYGPAGFELGNGSTAFSSETTYQLTGLTDTTTYDLYVIAQCPAGEGISRKNTFTTAGDFCSELLFTDSGADTIYSNDEHIVTTICPNNPWEKTQLTFTFVDIEATLTTSINNGCYDYLSIFDGPSVNDSIIAATLCGELDGDGTVPGDSTSLLQAGDVFISTHTSGCLTVLFDSDYSVAEEGWEATVDCIADCSVFETAPVDLSKSFDPVNGNQDRVQLKWYKESPQIRYSAQDAAACDLKFWKKKALDPLTGQPIGAAISNPDTLLIVDAKKFNPDNTPKELFKWPIKYRADGANNSKRVDPNFRYEWQVRCACEHGAGVESPWSDIKIFNTPDFDTITGLYTQAGDLQFSNMESKSMGMDEIQVSIFPNPTNGSLLQLTLSGIDGSPSLVQIIDLAGKQVYQEQVNIQEKGSAIELNFSPKLSSGTYFLVLELEEQIIREKFMVK